MRITRVFSGDDGESHFEDIEIPLTDQGRVGAISKLFQGKGVIFRETEADYHLDFHNAPRRQFVIGLSGGTVELEVGDGTTRRFGPGDVLLAEDLTGRGHISRAVDAEPRVSIFIPLDD